MGLRSYRTPENLETLHPVQVDAAPQLNFNIDLLPLTFKGRRGLSKCE